MKCWRCGKHLKPCQSQLWLLPSGLAVPVCADDRQCYSIVTKERIRKMIAFLKTKNGSIMRCPAVQKRPIDSLSDWIFKQKILMEQREITLKDAIKALQLGFDVLINCKEHDWVARKVDLKNNHLISTEDHYFKINQLKPDTKFFLIGYVTYGEYAPF